MRPIIKFLDYYSPKDTDMLQEYFVPLEQLIPFIDSLREIIKKEHVNLLSVTIRYMPKDKESFLSYGKSDSFAFVLYVNQKLASAEVEKARSWTRQIVDLALNLGGTYYLPYQSYPSREQLLKSYPEFNEFIEKKKLYDPAGIFNNQFYERYCLSENR